MFNLETITILDCSNIIMTIAHININNGFLSIFNALIYTIVKELDADVPSTSQIYIKSYYLLRQRNLLMVELRRIELLTPCLQSRCSPSWATAPKVLPLYSGSMVGPSGFEPLTPALSARCSNQLSYRPMNDQWLITIIAFYNKPSHFKESEMTYFLTQT
jgi:hypothetical protein